MAFVYEVERPPLFNQKKATSEIGPGQYLPLTLYKFEKPSAAPFGASAKRGSLFKLNQFPGPGAYNPKEDQNISYQKKSNIYDDSYNNKKNNKNKNKEKIMKKINVIEGYQNKSNFGFFTKVERFSETNKLNTPGPGTYDDKNILLAKSIEEKCYNNKEIIYNINKGRHNVYSVNRFDRQFPWNSEVISFNNKKNKKKKNKSVDINKKMKYFKNMENNASNSITISKLEKNKTIKSDSSNNMDTNINNFLVNNNLEEKHSQKLVKNKIRKNKNIILQNNKEKNLFNYNFKFNSEGGENNNIKINKSNENKTFKRISTLKKSKTSSNFFNQEKTIKKELKQQLNNEMKYRISSIPSKFSQGYEIEQTSGKVIRRPIKTYFKIFSGDKNDAVGPGSYELNLAEDWRKTGTSWSKYLVKKDSMKLRPKSGLSYSVENKDIINYNRLDKDFKKIMKTNLNVNKNQNTNKKFNMNSPSLYQFYSTQHVFFHPNSCNIKLINDNILKDKLPDFIPVNNVPGPGYYYDEEKINQNNKKGKNDFSKLKNAHLYDEEVQYEIEDEGNLGPGTYFNDILNLNKKNKNLLSGKKTKSVPFLCTSKRFPYETPPNEAQYLLSKEDYQYLQNEFKKIGANDLSVESSNTSNSTHKFGFSYKDKFNGDNDNVSMSKTYTSKMNKFKPMNGTFYRRDMRFRENVLEENRKKEIPGPGSYINPYSSTGKTNTVKVDGRYMDIRSCRVLIEKNRANKFYKNKKINKNIMSWLGDSGLFSHGGAPPPPVGTYDPEKTLTILYDINKNKKYGNKHFNSTQFSDRNGFYLFQKNAPNGPGCYYHDKTVDKKQNSAAFNSTADRFFLGGKNNTRNLHEMPKKMMDISVKKNKEGESSLGLTEKVVKDKNNEYQKSILSNNSTPNIVGPGSYHFLPEVYPWVKQSYNTKFN